jgi:hypothetical protein
LSLRATSPSGKRCIPSLWSSASRRSPPADLATRSPSGPYRTLSSVRVAVSQVNGSGSSKSVDL